MIETVRHERPEVTMMSKFLISLTIISVFAAVTSSDASKCGEKELEDHPVLCHMLEEKDINSDALFGQMNSWAASNGLLVDLNLSTETSINRRSLRASSSSKFPVVFSHGMGDSCFNRGMKDITSHVGDLLGVYATCIPTGDTETEDTKNGYFLNMDASVDVFASKVKADPKLKGGFHAIGFSQGNNIIRGYIAKYNDPVVQTFISVNGVNAGIGAVPYCIPEQKQLRGLFSMCDLLMEQASRSAYTEFAQQHSFQANYWRDPRPSAADLYHQYGQLAVWNNEAGYVNETLKSNWGKTEQFVWVLATEDGMIWPRDGEQWGAPDSESDDPFHNILEREKTEWYQKDLFGLKTAEEAGKNHYESFEGE
jgi:palmitoyl-protein thioesterase